MTDNLKDGGELKETVDWFWCKIDLWYIASSLKEHHAIVLIWFKDIYLILDLKLIDFPLLEDKKSTIMRNQSSIF